MRKLTLFLAGLMLAATALADDDSAQGREILVMLHLPAAHYRPGDSYGGAYDDASGRLARRRIAEKLAGQYGLTLLSDWPMPALDVDCYVMQAPSSQALADAADRIARDPRIESVQPLNTFRTLGLPQPDYTAQPSVKFWHIDELHAISTGRGVRIAIVDSGVDAENPDLAGQIAVRRNFVDARALVGEAHGTAVAAIIGARAGDRVLGIAPQATLVGLRACWEVSAEQTLCNSFTLAKSLQFALDDGDDVINLSLSGPEDKLVARLIDVALARGATVVGATDSASADGGFPASHAGVLAVTQEADTVRRGPAPAQRPFLIAPGRDILTAAPGPHWTLVSGSSFAAAHISGLVALVRQLAHGDTMRERRSWITFAAGAQGNMAGVVDACNTLRLVSKSLRCAQATENFPRPSW
jgi:subtilisin family serine protease